MIEVNIHNILNQIKTAQAKSPYEQEVTLVAVTKKHPLHEITEVIDGGVLHIGENRVQEAVEKNIATLPVKKHLIGSLQTNKIKKALEIFDVIQSVDRIRLAEEIDKEAKRRNQQVDILLEVNFAKEPQKHGFYPEEVLQVAKGLKELKNLTIKGLMGMAPLTEDPETVRYVFKGLRSLYDTLKETIDTVDTLSMGMSDDFHIAVEEGATMVRVGSKIFQ